MLSFGFWFPIITLKNILYLPLAIVFRKCNKHHLCFFQNRNKNNFFPISLLNTTLDVRCGFGLEENTHFGGSHSSQKQVAGVLRYSESWWRQQQRLLPEGVTQKVPGWSRSHYILMCTPRYLFPLLLSTFLEFFSNFPYTSNKIDNLWLGLQGPALSSPYPPLWFHIAW